MRVREGCFVFRQLAFGLGELNFEGTRVDLDQRIVLVDGIALAAVDFHRRWRVCHCRYWHSVPRLGVSRKRQLAKVRIIGRVCDILLGTPLGRHRRDLSGTKR